MATAAARFGASMSECTNSEINKIRKPTGSGLGPSSLPTSRVQMDERLRAFVDRAVASAPPLTPEQRDRLSVLLRGGA